MSADHGTPQPTLPEPKTPNWLPALGAFLFFAVGVWWLATAPAAPASTGVAADAGAPAASAAAPSTPPAH